MKTTILALCLFYVISALAQVPVGYYDNANGKTGDALKSALNGIIKGHIEFEYTDTDTDTWDILKESDKDPNNPDNVIYFYTGRSENAAQEYNNATGWSREHVWAKSRGDFGTDPGPGTDCHHLRPADISVNSTRSNRAFAEGGDEVWDEGVFTGCYKGVDDFTFEPRDAVKGDVARMIFYMVVRYEGEGDEPDLELTEQILPTTDKQPIHGVGSVLLQWHNEDPVDDFERNRNEVVYSYQGNRNPFIDHPEYVESIWGSSTSTQDLTNGELKIIKRGSQIQLSLKNKISNIKVYTVSGHLILLKDNIHKSEVKLPAEFKKGIYILVVNDTLSSKIVIN